MQPSGRPRGDVVMGVALAVTRGTARQSLPRSSLQSGNGTLVAHQIKTAQRRGEAVRRARTPSDRLMATRARTTASLAPARAADRLLTQQRGAGPAFTKEDRVERIAYRRRYGCGRRCPYRSHRAITAAMSVAASMPMPHTRQIRSLRCALSALARCHASQRRA